MICYVAVAAASEDMKYLDKLPEMCRDHNTVMEMKGEDLLNYLAACGIETVVLKYRYPEFPHADDIPSTPVPDADCTFSKIMSLLVEKERGELSMACSLRGIIGKDPDKVSNNEIRRTIKNNAAKLLETARNFSDNCSSEDFQDTDFLTLVDKIVESDKCMIIGMIKHRANAELYEDDDEEDFDNNDSDEKKNEVNDKGVMEVIKEQMKGILKLIKTSTGRDISDDGNIIIAYTDVFQVKPSKNTN